MNNRSKAVIHIANTPTSKVLELRARLDKALKAQSIHGYSTNLLPRTKKVGSLTVIFKYNYKVDSMSIIHQELSQYGTVEGYEPQQSTTPAKPKRTRQTKPQNNTVPVQQGKFAHFYSEPTKPQN